VTLDLTRIRKDFPILDRQINGKPLVFLDSAASSQKPQVVIDAMTDYLEHHHANVHRGIYVLAEEATAMYEGARDKVAAFINAADRAEVVFAKNSTEALNLVAHSAGAGLKPGDEILITEMEHHSNLVPWLMLAERSGATLRWIGLTDDGRLDLSNLDELLTERTRIVSVVHQSNILGTVNPVEMLAERAHAVGALLCVDASQAVPNMPYDVQALGADFVAFTGHKMCGPTGIGVLWGRRELLEQLPPFLGGGEMIETVTMTGATYSPPPHKFEAGTPMIAEAVGLGAAVDYLTEVGIADIRAHELDLTAYALDVMQAVDGLTVIGPREPVDRGAAISFTLAYLHPHDVGQVLDELGIAVRVGQHCAAPVCNRYGVPATTRASFYLYTTREEIDALVEGLEHVKRFFRAA
jgi:cysteine desulfurase/selenocysteine lyase